MLYLFVIDVSEVEEFDQTVSHSEKVVQCEDHHTVVIHDVLFLVNKVGNHRMLQIVKGAELAQVETCEDYRR